MAVDVLITYGAYRFQYDVGQDEANGSRCANDVIIPGTFYNRSILYTIVEWYQVFVVVKVMICTLSSSHMEHTGSSTMWDMMRQMAVDVLMMS